MSFSLIHKVTVRQPWFRSNYLLSIVNPFLPKIRNSSCNISSFAGYNNNSYIQPTNFYNHVVVKSHMSTITTPRFHNNDMSLYYFTAAISAFITKITAKTSYGVALKCNKTTMATINASLTRTSTTGTTTMTQVLNDLLNSFILYNKRTFQPSIIRKKRKTGFLVRQRTVGGRKMLARRRAKGRARLGGGIWI